MMTVGSGLSSRQSKILNDFEDELDVLTALADDKRQHLITLLCEHSREGLTVSEITRMMPITQPAVSHHLKILRKAGLVTYDKRGLESIYRLTLREPFERLEKNIHAMSVWIN
ncbi:ArsR/SmtB family transcription factor [Ligilactobacillus equi]|uniref:ArsR family transcriptional regulator n=1 Tax=Ligilactobacillus equi DPC 6820 TaxID=1392007 RepID=V7HXL3_9LACO|nr:metalloregulator ArsR/SmtB family transcription factor [Ligilactobacillus equi]ETA74030.1 ArsR family transcriptional regulator [Ligilactobacillus equi DPC 6820]MCQ2556816.1 metalloregulator ArsR/SmtB family transcription factor [Ligilactobacillus sp.]